MKRTLFLLYTLCLFYITPTFSQDSQGYSFMHTNSETGLSQSNVKTVIQDSYGFIWFGTKNGLNRYDGQRVVNSTVTTMSVSVAIRTFQPYSKTTGTSCG